MTDFSQWMQTVQAATETDLARFLPEPQQAPQRLHDAMRYAVLGGGKRVRPLLVYAAGELFDADTRLLARAGCALEMIHA
jgi:farnesyl diphosphate synthase